MCSYKLGLTDELELGGGLLVLLTKSSKDHLWLSGRFLFATWDADELLKMREAIVKSNMLKARTIVV